MAATIGTALRDRIEDLKAQAAAALAANPGAMAFMAAARVVQAEWEDNQRRAASALQGN